MKLLASSISANRVLVVLGLGLFYFIFLFQPMTASRILGELVGEFYFYIEVSREAKKEYYRKISGMQEKFLEK